MARFCEDDFDLPDPVEAHWSARTILSIFFAASLISALFFGLGYSFGGAAKSKRSTAIVRSDTNGGTGALSDEAGGNLTGTAVPQAAASHDAAPSPVAATATAPANSSAESSQPAQSNLSPQIHSATVASMPQPAAAVVRAHTTPLAKKAVRTQIMVQVGAIGNRRDADRLVAELREKGFHAGIYSGKRDRFLHVQIGPFKDAQRAQVKRHQVMASGFRAILKRAS